MEISQFRVVIRAGRFKRSCRFYGQSLALPRLGGWERAEGRGALYQAGPGVIEVLGRSASEDAGEFDEAYDYQGPLHKLTLVLLVPSAEKAYEEALFRDKEIPGGLRRDTEGLLFETHDPDGVKIYLRQAEG